MSEGPSRDQIERAREALERVWGAAAAAAPVKPAAAPHHVDDER